MKKLSIIEMKTLIGGGDDGETGHGTKGGDGGETSHGNRSTCMAMIQYRHSNHVAVTRVANCEGTSKEGGKVLSCSC